jgi:hypothetical protein
VAESAVASTAAAAVCSPLNSYADLALWSVCDELARCPFVDATRRGLLRGFVPIPRLTRRRHSPRGSERHYRTF